MKRTFKTLLAAAALAFVGLGALLAATPANAAISCLTVATGANWPQRDILSCGPDGTAPQGPPAVHPDAETTQVLNAALSLSASAPDLYNRLVNTHRPTVFVFRNQTEFNSYWQQQGLTPPALTAGIAGATIYSGTTPVYTVVFLNNGGNAYPANTAIHELGHWADWIYRQANSPTATRVSDSTLFADQMTWDWLSLNTIKQCGTGGIFTNNQNASGTYFCSSNGTGTALAGTYAGQTNKGVLQLAFPFIFDNSPAGKEIFAEAFAVQSGYSDAGPRGLSKYFALPDRFACSRKFTQIITTTGNLNTAITSLEAAGCHKTPTVSGAAMPSGLSCALVEQGTTFTYPYKTRFGQYVYCGATPATYKFAAGDRLQNMPGDVFGTSYMKNRFQTNNVTLYVFRDYLDAQARLGAAALPADIGNAFKYGAIQETAGIGNARTKFIVVFERVKDNGGAWVTVPSLQFRGSVLHYAGRMIDFLAARPSGSAQFVNAYNTDRTNYNALPTCQVLSFMCVNNVVVAPYNQAPYAGKTNLERLLIWRPEYTKYFMDSEVAGQYRGLFAEGVAMSVLGSGENLNGVDTYLNTTTQFGKCTRLYSKARYDKWDLPTAADLTANSCP